MALISRLNAGVAMLTRKDPNAEVTSEHDVIRVFGVGRDAFDRQEAREMEDAGWAWDAEMECWYHST